MSVNRALLSRGGVNELDYAISLTISTFHSAGLGGEMLKGFVCLCVCVWDEYWQDGKADGKKCHGQVCRSTVLQQTYGLI